MGMDKTGQNVKLIIGAIPRSGSIMTWQMAGFALGNHAFAKHIHKRLHADRDTSDNYLSRSCHMRN